MKKVTTTLFFILFILVRCNSDDQANNEQNTAPTAPVLSLPLNNQQNVDLEVTLSWTESDDPENDAISYKIKIGIAEDALNEIGQTNTTSFILENLHLSTTYYWKISASDSNGNTSESEMFKFRTRNLHIPIAPITDNPPFGSRFGHATVTFNNQIFLIGGISNNGTSGNVKKNDVWVTTDGQNWTEIASTTAFSPRHSHNVIVFNDKLWLIGGVDATGKKNDIWFSDNGIDWQEAISSATHFLPRSGSDVAVFNNKLWLIGGSESGSLLNDIWSSSNGIDWQLETETPPFSQRHGHKIIVFNNKLWLVGGLLNGTGFSNDIWFSENGVDWQEVSQNIPFEETANHTLEIFDNKIFKIAGSGSLGRNNSIWYSSDGIVWHKIEQNMPFAIRQFHATTVFDNKIWLFCGLNGIGLNDVWAFN